MTTLQMLNKLTLKQILVSEANGKLLVDAPKGALTEELIALIKTNKDEIVGYLREQSKAESKVVEQQLIPKVDRSGQHAFPMSFAQKRLWFIDQMFQGSPQYNLPIALQVNGDFDLVVAEQAMVRIIKRHESLRTTFVSQDGVPSQVVNETFDFTINIIDVQSMSESEQIDKRDSLIALDNRTAFRLDQDLMVRVSYIKASATSGVMLFNMHHIASDEWSMGIVLKEFVGEYQAIVTGSADPFEDLAVQYLDYAHWQTNRFDDKTLERQLDYWHDQLNSAPMVHGFPLDYVRGQEKQLIGHNVYCHINVQVTEKLRQLARDHNATLFMVLHAALCAVMSRHSHSNDIVLGTSVANRLYSDLENMIGFFVNSLALRVNTNFTVFDDLLAHVKQVNLDAQANQEIPFDQVVDKLNVLRSAAHNPLTQISFSMDTVTNAEPVVIEGVTFEALDGAEPLTKSDLRIRAGESEDGIKVGWLYDISLFSKQRIEMLAQHYVRFLTALVESPQLDLVQLLKLGEKETEHLVIALNDTQVDNPQAPLVAQWFVDQAQKTPHNIAFTCEGHSLDYRQLDHKSHRLALYLAENQIGRGQRVGILLPTSGHYLVAMLAVLRSGAAYVPLLRDQGRQRLSQIVIDAEIQMVLTDDLFEGQLKDMDVKVKNIQSAMTDHQWLAHLDGQPPLMQWLADNQPSLEQSAYVIYTSGSTGKPKGVNISHRGILDYCQYASKCYYRGVEGSIVATQPVFDITLPALLLPLLHGGCVNLPGMQEPISYLLSQLTHPDCRGQLLRLTPMHVSAILALLAGRVLEQNHVFVVGGDVFQPSTALALQRAFVNSQIFNHYGPSETVIGCTIYDVSANIDNLASHLPIGRPMDNTVVYVMDNGQLVPKGSIGELVIGGHGVAIGYVNQPELTALKFIANPFAHTIAPVLYRSGDLVRWNNDDQLEFVARIDEQVKIRGYRIELGEIGYQLASCYGVESSIVVVKGDDENNSKLVAYVVAADKIDLANFKFQINEQLHDKLPDYMVPSIIEILDQLPLTANGKIDRKALPEPKAVISRESAYIAPKTTLEIFMVETWQDVLSLDQVSVDDDFFKLGGHSLLAIQVISRIQKKLGEIIHVAVIFDRPSVKDLCLYLTSHYQQALLRVGLMSACDVASKTQVKSNFIVDDSKIKQLQNLIPATPKMAWDSNRKVGKMVFILSPPRSGSTLMRVMLAGNPNLFAPPELELLQFDTLAQRTEAFTDALKFRLEGTLRGVMEAKGISLEQAEQLMNQAQADGLTVGEFYRQIQSWIGNRLLVDKTPFYSYHPDILRQAEACFDDVHYIHLSRHPYGMINSFEKAQMDQILHLKQHDMSTRELAEMVWLNSTQNIVDFLANIPPQRQHGVSFEMMTGNPELVMRQICDFLDIPFYAAMIDPYGDSEGKMTDGIHAVSRMIGDVKFHTHKKIDRQISQSYKDYIKDDFLSERSWQLAQSLGYNNSLTQTNMTLPAIEALPPQSHYPMSFAQQRLWLVDQLLGRSAIYTNLKALHLKGEFDIDCAEQAMVEIIQRHATLRTVFKEVDSQPVQVIQNEFDFNIEVMDLSALTGEQQTEQVNQLVAQESTRVYNLATDLMIKMGYLKLAADQGILWLSSHHIASDGWSVAILIQEFEALYDAAKNGKPSPLPALVVQYADYAHWQRQWLQGSVLEKQHQYWDQQLANLPLVHSIRLDFDRPEIKSHVGKVISSNLPLSLVQGLTSLANQHKMTMFMLLHSAFSLVIARHSNSEDIVVGAPVANRLHQQLEPLIGFFVNTLVLRTDTTDKTLTDYLAHVRQVNIDAQNNQDIPFDYLVERLNAPRSLAYAPLFQIIFNMNTRNVGGNNDVSLTGLQISGAEEVDVDAKFDLHLMASQHDGQIQCHWLYDTTLFLPTHVEQIKDQMENVLWAMVNNPQCRLSELEVVQPQDLSANLLEITHRTQVQSQAQPKLFHQYFAQAVEQFGNKPAVNFDGQQLSFIELSQRANRLAKLLLDNIAPQKQLLDGLDDGSFIRIGLLFSRGLDVLVAIVAALQAGIAYVPINPEDPEQRIGYIVDDADLVLVLTQQHLVAKLATSKVSRLCIDDSATVEKLAGYTQDAPQPSQPITAQTPAYVIYTSGSTGKPKGVVNTQGNLSHFYEGFSAQLNVFELRADSGWLWNASYAFDASMKGLVTLCMGRVLVIPTQTQTKDPQEIVALLQEHQLEVFNGPPLLIEYVLEYLSKGDCRVNIIVSGDAVSKSLWLRIFNYCQTVGRRAINAYGPTETTVNAAYAVIDGAEPVNIGYPTLYTQALIINHSGHLTPKGAIGELYIGGPSVAPGYLNRPSQTARQFAFLKHGGETRFFRSGDLVRRLPNNSLEFIGRVDNQIKIRGYRIELDEIVALLLQQPNVKEAVVVTDNNDEVNKQLIAYVVPKGSQQTIDLQVLAEDVSALLPDYMVPSFFVQLAVLPLTSGGKVDVGSLAKSAQKSNIKAVVTNEVQDQAQEISSQLNQIWCKVLKVDAVNDEDNFFKIGGHSLLAMKLLIEIHKTFGVPVGVKDLFSHLTVLKLAQLISQRQAKLKPVTAQNCESAEHELPDTATRLAKIWQAVLKNDTIDAEDNFFKIGGHSLLAMKLLVEIDKEFNVKLGIKDLFGHLSIHAQTKLIDQKQAAIIDQMHEKITPVGRDKIDLPLSFSQQRLWFIDKMNQGSSEYNMSKAFMISGVFDITAAEQAMQRIVDRHEVLRTVYFSSELQPVQHIQAKIKFTISRYDLSHLSSEEQRDQSAFLFRQDATTAFDLSKDLMVRATYIHHGQHIEQGQTHIDGMLLFNTHHIASDAHSMALLISEFLQQYQAVLAGEPSPLQPLSVQYADFAHWQRQHLSGEALSTLMDYWQHQLADVAVMHSLPLDHPRPEIKTYNGEVVLGQLSSNVAQSLLELAKAQSMTSFMLLHGLLALVIARHSNNHDVVIGSPAVNRAQAQIEPMIGFFMNMMVLRTDCSHEHLSDYLTHVKKVHQGAQSHQEIPFEYLIEQLNVTRSTAHSPLFQIMFTVNNIERNELKIDNVTFSPSFVQSKPVVKFDLDIDASINEQGFSISWVYDSQLFSQQSIENINNHFLALLTAIAHQPDLSLKQYSFLSDREVDYLVNQCNDTAKDYDDTVALQQMFERQVELTPDRCALVFDDQSMTYQTLNETANRLAHYLVDQGVVIGDFVGLYIERSHDLLVAILAILKVGGAYVPIDPNSPDGRVRYILEDTQINYLISQVDLTVHLSVPDDCQVIALDAPNIVEQIANCPATALNINIALDSLAYVIYTSGSTGKPKGVMVEHRSVVNFIGAMKTQLGGILAPDACWMSVTSAAFDVSILDFFGPLSCGAKLVIASRQDSVDPSRWTQLLLNHDISCMQATPSAWRLLIAQGWQGKSDMILMTGGEALPTELASQLLGLGAQLWQCYGPTEATIWSMVKRIERQGSTTVDVSLGGPLDNYQHYILDQNKQLVPVGTVGELHIGGCLARGYHNLPALSQEKFFTINLPGMASHTVYSTGDLVRYLPNDQMAFLGRVDDQIKFRGYRIELGEIESQLQLLQNVDSAVVVASGDNLEQQRLVAYLVGVNEDTWQKQGTEKEAFVNYLRQALGQVLPEYMIPSAFVLLSQWPLTTSGKIDKNALPSPYGITLQNQYVAPQSEVELAVADIWAKLLNVSLDTVGRHDNFFALGGHSLLVIRLVGVIKEQFDISLEIREVFKASTLSHQALLIEQFAKAAKVSRDLGYERARQAAGGCIVKLNQADNDVKVFCLPPGMGNALAYNNLSDINHDVASHYGLQPPQIYNDKTFATMEELAAFYIRLIKLVQPTGKINLIGFSLGGVIAQEVARQLADTGDVLGYVAILDMPPSIGSSKVQPWYVTIEKQFILYQEIIPDFEFSYDWPKLQQFSQSDGLAMLEAEYKAQQCHIEGLDEELLGAYLFYFCDNKQLVDRFFTQPVSLDFSLYKTRSTTERSQYLNWDKFNGAGTIKVDWAQGTHETMMLSPHIQGLADKIRSEFEQISQRSTNRDGY